jgi:pimeloyl-ACP methyl ester carboxylesterase
MLNTYTEKVVSTQSRDGFVLEGLVIAPATPAGRPLLWIHGVYAAFYAPPGLEVCRALAQLGVTCVLANTRGHNVGAWIRNADGRAVLAGGAWESFADAPHDIAGWIDFAHRGDQGVVLAGHSLGARKVTMYLANEQDARVRGLVLASPSARAGSIDAPSEHRAKELIAQGAPNELLPIEPAWAASASNYLERFAAGSVNDAFASTRDAEPLLAAVRAPVLALLGGKERASEEEARSELKLLCGRALNTAAFTYEVVPGANHLYAGREPEVAARIASWIRGL